MLTTLRAISAACLILFTLSPFSTVRADQPFQRFLPLLVDLSGWQGKKPDGMSMHMSGAGMTTATRDYERGSAQGFLLTLSFAGSSAAGFAAGVLIDSAGFETAIGVFAASSALCGGFAAILFALLRRRAPAL